MKLSWLLVVWVGAVGCGPAVSDGDESSSGADGSGSTEPSMSGRTTTATTTTATTPTSAPVDDDASDDTTDVDSDDPIPPPDVPSGWPVEGRYLFGLGLVIAPETPLQFVGTVFADGELLDVTLTSLSLDFGSTTAPREPVGEAFVFESIPIAADGTFVLDFDEASIPGAANPITGSDVVADLRIVGWFNGRRICGNASGQVVVPANIDLAGSSFGGIPLEGEALPPIEDASCPFE